MDQGNDQRRRLGAFLRARREAARGDVPAGRRRTPGLRREEVAERCGISTTWFTWIEQGRDIAVSASALDRLARVLGLTEAERNYLFALAQRRDPAPPARSGYQETAPAELITALRTTTAPAYLMDRLWSVLAWNEAGGRLFAPWFDSHEACLLRYVLLDPSARDFIENWEERARRLIAEFRADTARLPADPAFRALVADLRRRSPFFTEVWNDQSVLAREGGLRTFRHPLDGLVRYEQVTLLPATHPGLKLVMLLSSGG